MSHYSRRMAHLRPIADLDTHEVVNQPPPFEDVNLFTGDAALRNSVARGGAGRHAERLAALGARVGSAEVIGWGVEAERNPPVLDTHDRYGRGIDEVRFHPAYHQLMTLGLDSGVASVAWDATPAGHALHAAILFLTGQADPGTSCPMTMTYASVAALAAAPAVAAEWAPRVLAGRYDPASAPPPPRPASRSAWR